MFALKHVVEEKKCILEKIAPEKPKYSGKKKKKINRL